MTTRRSHPLDLDLADLVDGAVDESEAAPLRAHLGDCLLCRIKQLRLMTAPPAGEPWSFPSPAFAVPAVDDRGDPAAGELWLAGDDERLLVLVLRTSGARALVAPVTFDVEAADDEAVLVEALGMGAVVYPALATEVPRSVLVGRLPGTLTPEGPGGSAIAGPTDPRLEVRQHLADHLGVA